MDNCLSNVRDGDCSSRLSECLDLSGYGDTIVKHRQLVNAQLDEMYNCRISKITKVSVFTTGGKGEGTAKYFESDIDRLYTHNEIVCVEENAALKEYMYDGEKMTIFRSRPGRCSPGYTRLELVELNEGLYTSEIRKSLVHTHGHVYLKNEFPCLGRPDIMIDIHGMPINKHTRSGPSEPYSNLYISYDFVQGFIYDSIQNLVEWSERDRMYEWPSTTIIKKVLASRGHVVPVASKTNTFLDTEWRICYTEAELILMKSMNEFQIKVYILLKLTSKSIFQPIAAEISSYVNKNVILWLAERHPTSYFTKEKLFQRFCEALCYLRDRVSEGKLASYIIKERNLLEGRISTEQRKQVADSIEKLLSMNNCIFSQLKIGNAFEAMATTRDDLILISSKRDAAEVLLLKKNIVFKRLECVYFEEESVIAFREVLANDAEFKMASKRLDDLIAPDIRPLQETGVNPVVKQRLMDLLS